MNVTGVMLAFGLLGFSLQEAERPPEFEPTPTQLEEIVVVGEPLRELVEDFVDQVAAPLPGRGPARWERIVCVGAVNLRRDAAQALVDRISEIALEIGLEVGEPGCSPNILVIATDDGSALATGLVQAKPKAFRPGYAGASASGASLERFQSSARPVRWWHVGVLVDADTGAIATRMPGEAGPRLVSTLGGLLRTEIRNDLRRAIVIVDIAQSEGLTIQQLGDYVAMVSLAQVDFEADTTRFETILNVFDDPTTERLTAWDRSYLRSLYDAELNQRNPNHQTGAVGRSMFEDREDAAQNLEPTAP